MEITNEIKQELASAISSGISTDYHVDATGEEYEYDTFNEDFALEILIEVLNKYFKLKNNG